MPLSSDPQPVGEVGFLQPQTQPDAPSAGETLGAAFRLENPIASAIANEIPDTLSGPFGASQVKEDFNPFEDIEGYEEHAVSFKDANSPDDVLRVKS